jgi:hypothetical protein
MLCDRSESISDRTVPCIYSDTARVLAMDDPRFKAWRLYILSPGLVYKLVLPTDMKVVTIHPKASIPRHNGYNWLHEALAFPA